MCTSCDAHRASVAPDTEPCRGMGFSCCHNYTTRQALWRGENPAATTKLPMDETLILQFDGGSRGNPGPAGIGVVIRAPDGTPLVTLGRYIGRATNNVAEYRALITAMEEAKKLGAKRIKIRGDSELVVRQMTGIYRVKHPDLIPLYRRATDLFNSFESAAISHNYREKNELADRLGNLAMDRRADVTEA